MQSLVSSLEEKLKAKIHSAEKNILESISGSLRRCEVKINDVEKEHADLKIENTKQVEQLDSPTRRNNFILFGMYDEPTETPPVLDEEVWNLLENKADITQ